MTKTSSNNQNEGKTANFFQAIWKFKSVKVSVISVAAISILIGITYSILGFALSSPHINNPVFEHYHFRMQFSVDGKEVDFNQPDLQVSYDKDGGCNASLAIEPIHFHDGNNQLVHIHWKQITGGELLKFYGINKIGGLNDYLGFRFDKGLIPSPVPIHGKILPTPNSEDKTFVYIGDKDKFTLESTDNFLKQDLKVFLKTPVSEAEDAGNPAVEHSEDNNSEQAALEEINHLLNNLVIFIQKDQPSNDQVKAAFEKNRPLDKSICGG